VSLLELDHVSLSISGTHILDDVTFGVEEGEILGLIGPNGAGKSSILNCAAGIYAPQEGDVTFEGRSVFGVAPHTLAAWGMARTFQAVSLDGSATVRENVMLGADLQLTRPALRTWLPHPRRKSRDAADRALELLDLTDYASEPAGRLPYGIQRSVELARAVAMEPTMLCLDEPTSGMSPPEKDAISALLVSLQSGGLTLLVIEHDVPFMTKLCHRLVALNFGSVLASGQPQDVLADPAVIESYLHPTRATDDEQAS
jgi:branched-chain amino acid transport system ATP-binding protein